MKSLKDHQADLLELKRLEWDSNWLGIEVYRLSGAGSSLAVKEKLGEARSLGASLIYLVGLVPPPDIHSVGAGIKIYYRIAVTDALNAGNRENEEWAWRYAESRDLSDLKALGQVASQVSRFRMDPRIPSEKVDSLYRAWVENSLVPPQEGGVGLLVSPGNQEALGMVTYKTMSHALDIGLLAVDRSAMGIGVGRALVAQVCQEALSRGCSEVTVTALEENLAACHFYEACGFSVLRRESHFHFWLDQQPN